MKKTKANTAPSTTARGQRAPKGVLRRLLRTLFEFYPVLLPVTLICILVNAIVSSVPAIFMQNIIAIVDKSYKTGDWASVSGEILGAVGILIVMYIISLIAGFAYTQLMAIITQGSLKKMREKMFSHMQDLPIKYFDTNGHGDIMSYYTNDVDTLRQMISQSLPQMLISGVTLLTVFCIMMYYSAILGLVVVVGVICMVFSARYVTSHSSKYFLRQQVFFISKDSSRVPQKLVCDERVPRFGWMRAIPDPIRRLPSCHRLVKYSLQRYEYSLKLIRKLPNNPLLAPYHPLPHGRR